MSERARAGIEALRDRTFTTAITVLGRQATANGAGGQTESWQVVATYRGRLRHARPMDYLQLRGGQQLPVGTWLVMLPTSAVVDSSQRIRVGNRTFTIVGDDTGRSDALVQTLICLLASDVGQR